MKFKYSLFIVLVIIFSRGSSLFGMDAEKPKAKRFSFSSILKMVPRRRFNSSGAIPRVEKREINPNKKCNSLSLLRGKKPSLPTAENRFPLMELFSEESERGSWEGSDEDFGLNLDTFDGGLSKFRNQEQTSSVVKVIALEYDMEMINTDEAFQRLLEGISVNMRSAKIDQGQKKIGLIMLYFNEGIELSQAHELFKIQGINAVKNGTAYTKDHDELILLVNKNLRHIDQEALINFYVEEGNLTLDQILEKLEQNRHEIEAIYNRVNMKLKKEKNSSMVKDLVLEIIEKAISQKETKQSSKPLAKDISEFDDSDIEDWDSD